MREFNDGGTAYPVAGGYTARDRNGMSLREWFAGQALAGMMSRGTVGYLSPEDISARCYEQADAMIKEGSK